MTVGNNDVMAKITKNTGKEGETKDWPRRNKCSPYIKHTNWMDSIATAAKNPSFSLNITKNKKGLGKGSITHVVRS